MKTIYLREKKSGNFELSNKLEATHKFKTQKEFKEWYKPEYWSRRYGQKHYKAIVKATYSQSQTYFSNADEVLTFIKKNNIF